MARTTVENTMQRIRRRLASGQRDEVSTLNGAVDASTTTMTLTYDLPAGLRQGAIVCVGTETMRVMAINSAAKTATVIRGWQDTDPAAHDDGAEVWINPRFQPIDIFDAMLAELGSWGPDLYRVLGVQATTADGQDTYELPASIATCYGLIAVYRQWDDVGQYLEPSTAWPKLPYRILRGTTAWTDGAATTGVQLRFTERLYAGTVFIMAAMPFDAELTTADDLVTDGGIQSTMLDVLEMGVIMRLLADDANARGSRMVQDEPRHTAETPWGGGVADMQVNMALYRRRKNEEHMKLLARYPYHGV